MRKSSFHAASALVVPLLRAYRDRGRRALEHNRACDLGREILAPELKASGALATTRARRKLGARCRSRGRRRGCSVGAAQGAAAAPQDEALGRREVVVTMQQDTGGAAQHRVPQRVHCARPHRACRLRSARGGGRVLCLHAAPRLAHGMRQRDDPARAAPDRRAPRSARGMRAAARGTRGGTALTEAKR